MPDDLTPILQRREFLGLLAFLPAIPRTPEHAGSKKTYSFSAILAGESEFTDDDVDALFEAGCDDGTCASCCGVASVTFTREAESLGEAVGSAIRDVERAGFSVSRIEIELDDLDV